MTAAEIQTESGLQSVQRLKYPKAVWFIISSEFCERYSWAGMRVILALFLRDSLRYSKEDSILIFHAFSFFTFSFSVLGGILADSYIGKFRTILFSSAIHATGSIVLALAATSWFLSPRALCLLGLFLASIGNGGLKPCVANFGGDQFVLPDQSQQLKRFFSIFFFTINIGALLATTLNPILRQDVKCLGEQNCYPLAFAIPAALMVLTLVIFVCGKPWYKTSKPERNILSDALKCICYALGKKLSFKKKLQKPSHWLQYAEDKFDSQLIKDVQEALKVVAMYIPVPLYWALIDQQGSSWTFQASLMDGVVYNWFTIKPDQISFLHPLLFLIFIPLYEVAVYPMLAKIGIKRPLQYITIGASLCASAYVIAAFVEYKLEPSYTVLPQRGLGQLRIFNGLPCQVELDPPIDGQFSIPPLEALQSTNLKVNGILSMEERLSFSSCENTKIPSSLTREILLYEEKSTSYVVSAVNGHADILRIPGVDDVTKSLNNAPRLRVIHNLDGILTLKNQYDSEFTFHLTATDLVTSLDKINSGSYRVVYENETVLSNLSIESGGVYTLVLQNINSKIIGNLHTITNPATLHLLWIVPQLFVITVGEIFFSVTYMHFCFTEAPESMRSVMASVSCMTVSLGNVIVVLIAKLKLFDRQAHTFLFYAGLMALDVMLLIALAIPYKYKKIESLEKTTEYSAGNDESKISTEAELRTGEEEKTRNDHQESENEIMEYK